MTIKIGIISALSYWMTLFKLVIRIHHRNGISSEWMHDWLMHLIFMCPLREMRQGGSSCKTHESNFTAG